MKPQNAKPPLWSLSFTMIFITNTFVAAGYYMLSSVMTKYLVFRGLPLSFAGVISGTITITAMLVRPFAGLGIDRLDNKKILMAGMSVVAVAMLLYPAASTSGALVAVRLLHGVGWGLCTTATTAVAGKCIPAERLSEGMGIYGLGQVLSMAIAPSVGLWVIERWGYTPMFMLCAALALVAVTCAAVIRMPDVPARPQSAPVQNPLTRLFAREAVLPASLGLCSSLVYSSISGFVAVYAEELGVLGIGSFFTVYAATLLFSRPLFGRLADRWDEAFILVPGLSLLALTCVAMSLCRGLPAFLATAVAFGIGFGGVQPVTQSLAMKRAPYERRGKASSTLLLGSDVGNGVGASAAGFLAGSFGYGAMYLWFCLPCLAGILIVLSAGRAKQRAA